MPIRPQPHSWTLILEGGPPLTKREGYPGPAPTYRKTIDGEMHEWRQKAVDEARRECVMEYAHPISDAQEAVEQILGRRLEGPSAVITAEGEIIERP